MSTSPRSSEPSHNNQTTKRTPSAPMIIIFTALDTTWRAFVPTIGGTVLGIWLDSLWGTSPIFLFVLLVGGSALSVYLIVRQLIEVRKK